MAPGGAEESGVLREVPVVEFETPIFDCLETIRSAGFHIIEICSHPAHLDYHDSDLIKKAAEAIRESLVITFSRFYTISVKYPSRTASSLEQAEFVD